ncbi:hypothetical protein D3C84_582760 [compost metagenome]
MFEHQLPLAEAWLARLQLSHELGMQKLGGLSGQDFQLVQPLSAHLIKTGRQAFLIAFVAHDQTPLPIANKHRVGYGVHQCVLECQLIAKTLLGAQTLLNHNGQSTIPDQR